MEKKVEIVFPEKLYRHIIRFGSKENIRQQRMLSFDEALLAFMSSLKETGIELDSDAGAAPAPDGESNDKLIDLEMKKMHSNGSLPVEISQLFNAKGYKTRIGNPWTAKRVSNRLDRMKK